jgi:endonuclease III
VAESLKKKRERALRIVELLDQEYPGATCELKYHTPFELLVATILSAQATDVKVNEVTADLFKTHNRPQDFAAAEPAWLESVLRPTGFFRNKTKSVIGASKLLLEQFHGKVPKTMAELIQLPGVSRKTASVVLGCAYGLAEGIVVDTHVARLSVRLGLTPPQLETVSVNTDKIERDLMVLIPQERWISFSHCLIWHGRRVCSARKPLHDQCAVEAVCPRVGVD